MVDGFEGKFHSLFFLLQSVVAFFSSSYGTDATHNNNLAAFDCRLSLYFFLLGHLLFKMSIAPTINTVLWALFTVQRGCGGGASFLVLPICRYLVACNYDPSVVFLKMVDTLSWTLQYKTNENGWLGPRSVSMWNTEKI